MQYILRRRLIHAIYEIRCGCKRIDVILQNLLKRDTRTTPKAKQLYLFSGFLKCADCGRAMSRIASNGICVYYHWLAG